MPDKIKRVRLRVEDEFSQILQKYTREIQGANTATQNFGRQGGGGIRQLMGDLRDFGLASQAVIGSITGVARAVDGLSQMGQTSLRNQAALKSLTATTEEYLAKVEAVQRATRQTTTESEAAALAARLQQFGLASTAQEMGAFVDTIARVRTVNPMLGDTEEAITQIQLTLSNMSFMRLDQLGLSAGQVRSRMAELKKETAGLSTEAAFQQAVMEGLATQAGRVTDEMMNIGNAQAQLKTSFREFRDNIGEYLTGRLDEAADSALKLSTILGELGLAETTIRIAYEVAGLPQEQAGRDTNFLQAGAALVTGLPFMVADRLGVSPSGAGGGGTGGGFNSLQSYLAYDEIVQRLYGTSNLQAPYALQGPAARTRGGNPMRPQFGLTPETGANIREAQRVASLPSVGFGFNAMQMGQRAVSWASAETSQYVTTIADQMGRVMSFTQGAASAAGDWMGEIERFSSVNEMLGVAPDALDADLYSRATDALRGANLEAELLAETTRLLGLETGVTNVKNEIFNERLQTAALALAEGRISAADYVNELRSLQTMDFTNIERISAALTGEQQAQFIGMMGAEGADATFASAFGKAQSLAGAMGLIDTGEEGGGEEANPFQSVMNDADALSEHWTETTKTMTDDAAAAWGDISTVGTEQFTVLHDEGMGLLNELQLKFKEFDGMTLSMNVSATLNGARMGGTTTGGRSILPVYAEGGSTGKGGGGEFLAWLHDDEFVVSSDMRRDLQNMPALSSGNRSREPIKVEVPVNIDGREIARVVQDVNFRDGKGGL